MTVRWSLHPHQACHSPPSAEGALFALDKCPFDTSAYVASYRSSGTSYCLTSRIGTLSTSLRRLIDIASVCPDTTTSLYNSARYRRNTEVPHDTDQEEDNVVPATRIEQIVGVTQCCNILLHHQHLYLCEESREDRAHG